MRCLLVILGFGTAQAQAQTTDPLLDDGETVDKDGRGRELYENGALLYEEGRYEDAIVAWEAAYALTQRPGFLFNIANAYERLADYDQAIDVLGRYRALARADERETLDRRIRNLEERLAEQSARAPVGAQVPVPAPSDSPTRSTAERTGNARPVIGLSLVGVGAASLLTGTGFGLGARSAGNQAESGCVATDAGLLCPDASGRALATNRRSALIADIGFGVGAAAATTGLVVLVTGGKRQVSVAPMGQGVRVAMRW